MFRCCKRNLGAIAGLPVLMGFMFVLSTPAFAITTWTDWTSAQGGAPGTASGTVNGIAVTYSGELDSAVINGTSPIWAPSTTYIGGTVTTSPSTVGDAINLNGSFTGVNTITFATPVVNPVFSIWSLGQPGLNASFTFDATPTVQAGGPNSIYGGSSISVLGNTVNGQEGNGVVQFTGTFSSISWTNSFENYYSFTVGLNGGGPAPVPEPSTLALLGLGVAGLSMAFRRYRVR